VESSGGDSVKFPESDFEIEDFSIGDIGLATAKGETSWKQDLEGSLEEPDEQWEEKKEEPEEDEEDAYSGEVTRKDEEEEEDSNGSDFYGEREKGDDLYSADSGNYKVRDEADAFYNPPVGPEIGVDKIRIPTPSKLEIQGLQKGSGVVSKEGQRTNGKDKKYTN
jgi:hypothetical protein